MMKKMIVSAALAAMLISSPAEGHDGLRRNNPYRDRDSGVSTAIIAGVLGIAIGAAIANSDDRRYDQRPGEWDYLRLPYEDQLYRQGFYFYQGYYFGPDGYYYRDRFYDDRGYGYRYYYRYRNNR